MKHIQDTESQKAIEKATFIKNGQNGVKPKDHQSQTDNKRYNGNKKKGTEDSSQNQDTIKKLTIQGVHTLSDDNVHQHANGIISEGALGALINSHINEGIGNLSACNQSFENTNMAYWTN